MFFLTDAVDIGSYADDNTPYAIVKKQYEVEKKKQIASEKLFILFKLFLENGMEANQESKTSVEKFKH